jgi:hypothetical protein
MLYAQEAWQRDHNAAVKAAKFAEADKLFLRSADEARKGGNSSLLACSLLDLAEVVAAKVNTHWLSLPMTRGCRFIASRWTPLSDSG